ncbi:integration host factor [Epidermidibacterium keratini]|uniref:Integration host factor n=1 Tax=Epidermidibacterium keratini TaxID=1891644 RepID=A0A7L4YKF4_9ACTN|nr:integration host factor, actinobacterial type [Epidermidibacterium keratini]QHB99016.1 integration host factor [Epidermidibacterium keratini]
MPLPSLTPEQRAAALDKAADARRRRAEFKENVKRGDIKLADVIELGKTDEVVGRTHIITVIESLPGIGKIKAARIMERVGISPSRRVRGLGAKQRVALEAELAGR